MLCLCAVAHAGTFAWRDLSQHRSNVFAGIESPDYSGETTPPVRPDTPPEPPENPVEPEKPTEPEKPIEPEKPVEPEKPKDPQPPKPKKPMTPKPKRGRASKSPNYIEAPKTGDEAVVLVWIGLVAAGVCGLRLSLPSSKTRVVQVESDDRAGQVGNDTHVLQGGKAKRRKRLSNALFYLAIVLVVIAAFVFKGNSKDSFQFLGYSGFTVLTGSMQREIPQGSLVLTKEIDPSDIYVGDDLTYIRSDNAMVTHRVIGIIDNHEGTGKRGFQTQGLENLEPDPDIVIADNVIGKVRRVIPNAGFILRYITHNSAAIFIFLGSVIVVAIGATWLLSRNLDNQVSPRCPREEVR